MKEVRCRCLKKFGKTLSSSFLPFFIMISSSDAQQINSLYSFIFITPNVPLGYDRASQQIQGSFPCNHRII